MKCWACNQDTMVKGDDGIYRCPCGATANYADEPTPKTSPPKPTNGTLKMALDPKLRERLSVAAKKRGVGIETYALQILNREVGRSHHKKVEKGNRRATS